MPKKKLRIFDTFSIALKNFETQDKMLFEWKTNRTALSHALAMQLFKLFSEQDQNLDVDMCPALSRSSKILSPEILVHKRQLNEKILSVVCRTDYLTEEEQKGLVELSEKVKCSLVLAIAFLPRKNHSLIYRVTDGRLEYYHFDRNTMTMNLLKISSLNNSNTDSKNKDQLMLGIVVNKSSK